MRRLLLAFTLLSASVPASAYTVQTGCAVPPATISGTTTDVNSAATLTAAIAAATAGGTITLESGNYGDVALASLANTSWLKIVADTGATPVFNTLSITHDSNLIIDGVTVQSENNTGDNNYAPLVFVTDGGSAATTSNIILANMSISSMASAAGLTQAQLSSELRNGLTAWGTADTSGTNVGHNGEPYTTCISVEGNHISNVLAGATLYGNQTLFTQNQVDHFGADGIDFGSNNLAITQNNVHDALNVAPGLGGQAAIQGWQGVIPAGAPANYFSNILISDNFITRQLDASLTVSQTALEGIVGWIYSDWTNVTVTNNVIVTAGCNGINFASIHGSLIANNSIGEESYAQSGYCQGGGNTVIVAGQGNGQVPNSESDTTRITANIAPSIQSLSGVTIDNNAGICNYDIDPFCIPISILGQRKNEGDQATLNNSGHGTDQIEQGQYLNFVPGSIDTLDLTKYTFDLHLSPYSYMVSSCDNYPQTDNSIACSSTSWFGRSTQGVSPANDVAGNSRFGDGVTLCTIPVPGAYSFPVPCSSGSGPGTPPAVPPPPAPP